MSNSILFLSKTQFLKDCFFVTSHGNFVGKELFLVMFLTVLVISKLHFFNFPVHESCGSGFQDRKQT